MAASAALWRAALRALAGLWLGVAAAAAAEPLPSPESIGARLQRDPVVVEVRHPHDGLGARAAVLSYQGFRARDVLDVVLGQTWRQVAVEVEFVAADGYRSAVPVVHLERYPAWLVYARADGGNFVTDNAFQGRKAVDLGPWYLVWDNLGSPELLTLGDHYWPYQVVEVSTSGHSSRGAR